MPSIVFLIALLVHMPFYCIALHLMFAEEILVIMVWKAPPSFAVPICYKDVFSD